MKNPRNPEEPKVSINQKLQIPNNKDAKRPENPKMSKNRKTQRNP